MSIARPRLRADLRFVEQVYRGEASFVVKDPATKKYFRFRPAEALVVRCFDGTRTFTEVASALVDRGVRVSAGAVEAFARSLTSLGLLERSLAERTTLQLERLRAERRNRRRTPLFRGELLRMRWSLGDPNRLFDRTLPYLRWCFSRWFLAVSVALFATYFVVVAATWHELSSAMSSRFSLATFTPGTLALLWLTFLAVAMVHEMAHGYTCKYFGGEVHELGVMVLYLQPAMYCNVSDAWSFPELRPRLWVTAAGGWIQLVLAGLASLVWLVVDPGTLAADAAVATMMIGGGGTLLANSNPLLPLDGYFALTDYLEIPNLRLRALEYTRWWMKRHLLRVEHPEPAVTARERRVFLVYGGLATLYITLVFILMLRLLLGWARSAFGATGAVLVVAAIAYRKRRSLRHFAQTVATSLRARVRGRPRRRRYVQAAALGLVLLAAPWPHTTTGSFVAAPAHLQVVTAPSEGVVASVLVDGGARVEAGAPLLRVLDFQGMRAVAVATRAVDSLTAVEARMRAQGRGAATEVVAAERVSAASRLAVLRQRAAATTVRAVAEGVVLTSRPGDLLGRYVTAGLPVLIIGDADSVELRVSFADEGATRVRAGQMVRLISDADAAHPARAMVASSGEIASPGAIEARVRLPATMPWRPGVRGEARAEIGRSTVFGALVRSLRTAVRGDLLL